MALLEEYVEMESIELEVMVDKSYCTSVESMSCRASGGTSVAASSYPGPALDGSSFVTVVSDLDVVLVVPHVVNSSSSVVSSRAGPLASCDGSNGSCGWLLLEMTLVSVVAVVSA